MNTATRSDAITIECDVHLDRRGRGAKKQLLPGPQLHLEPGRVPRIARLMALAIQCEQMLEESTVASYAELAELGEVTRPRMTQILNLLHLAPEIQEAVFFLPRTQHGRDPIKLLDLQPIAACRDWEQQRRLWAKFQRSQV